MKIKRFKELLKNIKPVIITAQPVHGAHSKPKKKENDLQEATSKPFFHELPNDNVEERHNKLVNHYDDYAKKLPGAHGDAIRKYTYGSHSLNKSLITQDKIKKEYFQDRIDHIDDVLKNAPPLQEDVHVYHGLTGWHPGKESFKHPERHIKLPAYTSTSLDRDTANDFSGTERNTINKQRGQKIKTNAIHMLKIHFKKGQNPGMYIDHHFSAHDGEKEFLMRRGSKLKIDRKPEIAKHYNHDNDRGEGSKAKKHYIWHAHYIDSDD